MVEALRVLLAASAPAQPHEGDLRGRCTEALFTLLSGLLRGRTLVVLLNGLQSADAESLEVLNAAADRAERGALCVLAGRPRAEWPQGVEEMMGRLEVHRHIELGALTEDEQREMVRSYLGEVQKEAWPLCEKLMERAAGNPFFLSEMIETLADQGTVGPGRAGTLTWVKGETALPLPTTVETMFAARLARLPAGSREYLILLSLCERSAVRPDPTLMDALLGERRKGDLSQLTEQGMVTTLGDGTLAIESPLLGDVAYASLPEEERHVLHAQLMQFLSSEAQTHVAATDIAMP
jgi:predicted ATPase